MIMTNKKHTKPPKIAEWILKRILPYQAGFTASGDYNELFHRIAEEEGISKARKWYWLQIGKSLLPFFIYFLPWSLVMFKNYLKMTFRNFKRHSIYSLINIAGLSTGVGSALAFFAKQTNIRFLSTVLGFSAGVMIYISFTELFSEAQKSLVGEFGTVRGHWVTFFAFFGGILIAVLIDKFVPAFENPHEPYRAEDMDNPELARNFRALYKVGLLTAVALAIHNFPEGFATFASALKDLKLGIPIAVAVAIHNIPEGIAVSIPVYYATGDRKKAFLFSFLSGLAEPLGALIGYLLLSLYFNDAVLGILLGSVAGIMVFISLDELLPAAREYGKPHYAIYGLVAGMMVMAVSLILFV